MRLCNDRTFSQSNPQMIIQIDAFLTSWGAISNGVQTSGQWSEEERTLHINVPELLAIKLALFSFTKGKRVKVIHSQSFTLIIGLFASSLCHQLSQYIAWHPDPYCQGRDAMIHNWNIGLPYVFPPLSMFSRVLLKIKQEYVPLLILIAPVWSTQPGTQNS